MTVSVYNYHLNIDCEETIIGVVRFIKTLWILSTKKIKFPDTFKINCNIYYISNLNDLDRMTSKNQSNQDKSISTKTSKNILDNE